MSADVEIWDERADDAAAIRQVLQRAFPSELEARLVDRLRDEGAVTASVVALLDRGVVGHALYSPARIELGAGALAVAALGPVAVLPAQQRRGLGSALVRAGIERCWAKHLPAILVLGDPAYYTRFGFEPAERWGIRCRFDAPPEAFMVLWASNPVAGPGVAHYHPAFDEV